MAPAQGTPRSTHVPLPGLGVPPVGRAVARNRVTPATTAAAAAHSLHSGWRCSLSTAKGRAKTSSMAIRGSTKATFPRNKARAWTT